MKTLVVGLGNPILGDDGVGWKIAEEVNRLLPSSAGIHAETNENFVSVEYLSLGGLGLMEHLVGYDNAILIDAFRSEEAQGSILVMRLEDMPNYSAFHITSVHDAFMQNALDSVVDWASSCRNILWLWALRQKNALNFVRT